MKRTTKWKQWLIATAAYTMMGQTLWASVYGEVKVPHVVAYNSIEQETLTLKKKDTFEISKMPTTNNTYDILLEGQTWTVVEDAIQIRKVIEVVQRNDVKIRKEPNDQSEILKTAEIGERISVLYQSENWYQVVLEDGKEGFIYKTQLEHPELHKLPKKDLSKSPVEVIQWSQATKVFARGEVATIEDVYTGKTFKVKRTFGTNHADVEALTQKDTATIKQIWGGFTWERRPVIVHIDGRRLAASLAGMPHAGSSLDAVKNNGMHGVIDLHFRGSRKHKEGSIPATTDPLHQKAISIAANYK